MALGHCRHRIHSLGWSIVMFFLIYWACIDEPWVSLVTRVQSAIKKRSNLLKNVSFTQAGCISEQQRTTSINNEYTSSLADGQYMLCPCLPLLSSSFRFHRHSLTERSDRTSQERAQTPPVLQACGWLLILVWTENTHRKRLPFSGHGKCPMDDTTNYHKYQGGSQSQRERKEGCRAWLEGQTSEHSGALGCYIIIIYIILCYYITSSSLIRNLRPAEFCGDFIESAHRALLDSCPCQQTQALCWVEGKSLCFYLGTTVSLLQLCGHEPRPSFHRDLETGGGFQSFGKVCGQRHTCKYFYIAQNHM